MSRQIISTTRADGTRSTYTLQPGSTVPMQLEALKPLKPSRIKADRRGYPKYKPGMSAAEYVRLYEVGNGGNMKCADFWQPLNTAPAAGYVGIDTVEHGDFDQITDDAPALPEVAELAPVAPAESEPVADAVLAELAPAAAPVDPVPAVPAILQAWQVVAAAASGQPGAQTLAEAEALALACLARYGQSHPAACAHLASFSAWHRAALAHIRAAAAPEPAAAGAPAADPAPWRGPDNAAARARVHAVHVRTARTAAAVAPTWHADGARLRRSVNAPGFDAASRQLRAAVAAALRAERAAAAADPAPAEPVPADLVADALAELVAIGWTAGPYPRAVCQLFDGVGPLGTMVTPNGTRRVIVSADDVGQLRAMLGDDVICKRAALTDAEHARRAARTIDEDVSDWVATKRRASGYAAPARTVAACQEPGTPAEIIPAGQRRPGQLRADGQAAPSAAAPAAAAAPVHPRMAEALAILAAAVQPVDPDAAADAAACADDALARVYGDAVADAVADAMAAAPPADPVRTARDGVDDRAARLAALLVGIIGTDPARLAPALRRESARVAAAAESVPGRIADGYRRTARALADMAAAEHARTAPDRDTLAPDAPRPDPAALVAELDQITAAARDRMGGRTGSELSAMTPAELARRHAILQQLPTFAEERQAARQRIAARLAARQARPAPARAAQPADGWRTIAARPAPAGAFAGLAMLAPGAPCGDIGAAARLPAAPPAGWRWRPDAPAWRGRQPAGAFPEPIGAAGDTRCSDIGAAAAGLTGAPEAVTRIHRGWPACTMSTRPGGIAARVRRPGADPGPPRVATSAHQYGAGPAPPARSRHHCTLTPPPSVATSAQLRRHTWTRLQGTPRSSRT